MSKWKLPADAAEHPNHPEYPTDPTDHLQANSQDPDFAKIIHNPIFRSHHRIFQVLYLGLLRRSSRVDEPCARRILAPREVVLDDTRHAVPQNLVLLKLYHGFLGCKSWRQEFVGGPWQYDSSRSGAEMMFFKRIGSHSFYASGVPTI